MANNADLVAKALGLASLPTAGSGRGSYGDYGTKLTPEQWAELSKKIGAQVGGFNQPGGFGALGMQRLAGTDGGYMVTPYQTYDYSNLPQDNSVNPESIQPTLEGYDFSYFPNYAGTRTAMDQSNAADEKAGNRFGIALAALAGAGMLSAGMGAAGAGAAEGAGGLTAAEAAELGIADLAGAMPIEGGAAAGYTGTAAELAADGLGGLAPSGYTWAPEAGTSLLSGTGGGGTSSPGLLQSVTDWASKNPGQAMNVAKMGMGLLGGAVGSRNQSDTSTAAGSPTPNFSPFTPNLFTYNWRR